MPVTVNINAIRSFKIANKSYLKESNNVTTIPRVQVDMALATCEEDCADEEHYQLLEPIKEKYLLGHATYEPSVFLWDILRKSKAAGFFLALSGGMDSCAVTCVIYNMAVLVLKEIDKCLKRKESKVLKILR